MKSGTDTEQSRLVTPPTPRVSADPRARDPRATGFVTLYPAWLSWFPRFLRAQTSGVGRKKSAEFHNLVFFSVVSLGNFSF